MNDRRRFDGDHLPWKFDGSDIDSDGFVFKSTVGELIPPIDSDGLMDTNLSGDPVIFAYRFDDHLRSLGYRAPEIVAARVHAELAGTTVDAAADLGCGTGLLGPLLREVATLFVGVDLSPRMLERAIDRGYDELVCAELTEFLLDRSSTFDMLVSADTLNSIGDLTPVFVAAHRALRSGCFAFTLELDRELDHEPTHDGAEGPGYRLTPSGRFGHRQAWVVDRLRDAGFGDVDVTMDVLRQETRQPVHGLVVTARR